MDDSGTPSQPGPIRVAAAAAEPVHSGPVRDGPALSAEDLAWEGQGRGAPRGGDDAPALRVEGFEGPLDWLLEQARARRVDLARLSVLALIEQCVAAIAAALARRREGRGDGSPAPVPLQRVAGWAVMAAWLAELRSRLLLPADEPEARAARDEVEALRRQLAERQRVREAVAWLDAQPQLGCHVFARGGVVSAGAKAERVADLPGLLRTYARLIGALQGTAAVADPVYRPRLPLLWRIPDAMAHLKRLLPARLRAEAEEGRMSLWSFLPGPEALARAGQAHATTPERALLRRSAVASTFVAGLELARQGRLALAQDEAFSDVQASASSAVAMAERGDDGAGARRT